MKKTIHRYQIPLLLKIKTICIFIKTNLAFVQPASKRFDPLSLKTSHRPKRPKIPFDSYRNKFHWKSPGWIHSGNIPVASLAIANDNEYSSTPKQLPKSHRKQVAIPQNPQFDWVDSLTSLLAFQWIGWTSKIQTQYTQATCKFFFYINIFLGLTLFPLPLYPIFAVYWPPSGIRENNNFLLFPLCHDCCSDSASLLR